MTTAALAPEAKTRTPRKSRPAPDPELVARTREAEEDRAALRPLRELLHQFEELGDDLKGYLKDHPVGACTCRACESLRHRRGYDDVMRMVQAIQLLAVVLPAYSEHDWDA